MESYKAKNLTKKQAAKINNLMPPRAFLLLREIVEMKRNVDRINEQDLVDRLYGDEHWQFSEDEDGRKCSPREFLDGLLNDVDYLSKRGFTIRHRNGEVYTTDTGERVYEKVIHPLRTKISDYLSGRGRKASYKSRQGKFRQTF